MGAFGDFIYSGGKYVTKHERIDKMTGSVIEKSTAEIKINKDKYVSYFKYVYDYEGEFNPEYEEGYIAQNSVDMKYYDYNKTTESNVPAEALKALQDYRAG